MIFSKIFLNFFRETSLISPDVCYDHNYFINLRKAKIYECTYFKFIRNLRNIFQEFLSVLTRLYLNNFFFLLSEVKLAEKCKISFRQQIWIFVSDHMYDFCMHVNISYFNNLFKNMKFLEDYTAVCYRILNDDSAVIDLT